MKIKKNNFQSKQTKIKKQFSIKTKNKWKSMKHNARDKTKKKKKKKERKKKAFKRKEKKRKENFALAIK